jgi:histone H3/H4
MVGAGRFILAFIIAHYQKLPDSLNEHDLKAVARSLLPEGDRKSIETLVAYAQASAKYLAGIETVVRRARFLAAKENRSAVSFADIKLAIQENVIPSDSALAEPLSTPIKPHANRLQVHCRPSARWL